MIFHRDDGIYSVRLFENLTLRGALMLGVEAGDTVMLHASIRAVGRIIGGPDQIHLALKEALTGSGTLVMYASCPEFYDEVGRGNLSADEERMVLAHLPAFDPYADRCQRDNGALVELLRTCGGVLVNEHVARFVAWGRLARHLVAPQPWNFPFGHGSLLEVHALLALSGGLDAN